MRVLHVIPSLAPSSGGPSLALPAMAKALHAAGVEVEVATTDDDGPGTRIKDCPLGVAVQHSGMTVRFFPKQSEFYKRSYPLTHWLWKHVRDYSLVHIHALFSYSSTLAALAARARAVPYVIRPLGVLNQYGMNRRRKFIKALSFRLIEKDLLRDAAAIHYTSTEERDEAARLGLTAPARVIPLGVDLPPWGKPRDGKIFLREFPALEGRQFILFMSRLDPKKGVEFLLEVMARLQNLDPGVMVAVGGAGPASYVEGLKAEAVRLGVAERIVWTGHLEADLKYSAFAAATLFALPSLSENFGIALLEAMASGLPCIASHQVALAQEAGPKGAVLAVERDAAVWSSTIHLLLRDDSRRQALGQEAAKLSRNTYSLDAMGTALKGLYEDILYPTVPSLHT